MKIEILFASQMFSVAELSAMALDLEIVRYYEAYSPFGFVETRETRAKYLALTKKKRARANSSTAVWVACGGVMPEQLDLVEDR